MTELIKRLRDEHVSVSRTEAADRIEELMNGVDGLGNAFAEMAVKREAAEAKLAKAVEALEKLNRRGDALETFDNVVHEIVTAALAELEGM